MVFIIEIKPKARKSLDKIPAEYRARIIETLDEIALDPFVGKKLKGEYENQYSYRVWPYRIIYEIRKNELVVLVIRVGHRQGVYK